MSQPSISIFLPSLVGGGAERMMVNLARGLIGEGVEVDLVLANATGEYLEQIPPGVRLVDLQAGRTIAAIPGLVRHLRRRRPDVLLSALDHANLTALTAQRLSGVATPVFVSVRNTLSVSTRGGQRLGDRLTPALARRFYPKARGVIAVSRGVATDLVSRIGLSPNSVTVIYNPVVTPELEEHAAAELDHPWFSADAVPVILAAGRLSEQKDFMTLIVAFSQVRAHRDVRLLILGEGPLRAELETEISRRGLTGDVRLEGFVDNPFAYMRRASLFVLSSLWEGLPGVLIQAMACGTPVVSTDCPSGPREILEDGRLGPLVPTADSAALADAILNTLERPTPEDVLRKRAADFSLETITRQYLDVLFADGRASR
jgi:glycosyltransferase involved in cell wall biosynthesis